MRSHALAIPLAAALVPGVARGFDLQTSEMLQGSVTHQRFGEFLADDVADRAVLEARLDATVIGSRWQVVARPRLRAFETDTNLPQYQEPRHVSFTEAYASADATQAWRVAAGKHYLSWGPGLLYSPSNRLFPDNGSAGPRQEIDGKWMAWTSVVAADGVQLTALAADPYLAPDPDVKRAGAFYLARAERVATAGDQFGWGLVAGGGGGLLPYIGGYLQRSAGDAFTFALEWSASRGYASTVPGMPRLAQNQRRWNHDAALSLRYGLSDGGELAVEYIGNGYHLDAQEADLPAVALLPASASTQSRYAAQHPLTERHYLNLQANFPKVFGYARWTLFLRHLEAPDRHGRLSFAELGYSPADHLTLYAGATVTSGSAASSLVRSIHDAAYVTAELVF